MDCGAKTIYGDLMFAVGLPIPLHRLQTVTPDRRASDLQVALLPGLPNGEQAEVNNGRCRYGSITSGRCDRWRLAFYQETSVPGSGGESCVD